MRMWIKHVCKLVSDIWSFANQSFALVSCTPTIICCFKPLLNCLLYSTTSFSWPIHRHIVYFSMQCNNQCSGMFDVRHLKRRKSLCMKLKFVITKCKKINKSHVVCIKVTRKTNCWSSSLCMIMLHMSCLYMDFINYHFSKYIWADLGFYHISSA